MVGLCDMTGAAERSQRPKEPKPTSKLPFSEVIFLGPMAATRARHLTRDAARFPTTDITCYTKKGEEQEIHGFVPHSMQTKRNGLRQIANIVRKADIVRVRQRR